MRRDWTISVLAATVCHVAMLYAFQAALSHPPRLTRNTAVEVTLVAAPAEPAAVVVEAPKPVVASPPAPQPIVAKPPEPPPVVKAVEPVVKPVKPVVVPIPPTLPSPSPPPTPNPATAQPPQKIAAAVPVVPVAPAVGDGSSPKLGQDQTSQQAQPGVRAKPNYLKNPEPPYPATARRRRQEGLVLLTVNVTAQGRAARIELKQSSGFPALDEAALQAVRGWDFEPARVGPLAVESTVEVPVRFKLTD